MCMWGAFRQYTLCGFAKNRIGRGAFTFGPKVEGKAVSVNTSAVFPEALPLPWP